MVWYTGSRWILGWVEFRQTQISTRLAMQYQKKNSSGFVVWEMITQTKKLNSLFIFPWLKSESSCVWTNDNCFYFQDYYDGKFYHHANVNYSKPQKYLSAHADVSLVSCKGVGVIWANAPGCLYFLLDDLRYRTLEGRLTEQSIGARIAGALSESKWWCLTGLQVWDFTACVACWRSIVCWDCFFRNVDWVLAMLSSLTPLIRRALVVKNMATLKLLSNLPSIWTASNTALKCCLLRLGTMMLLDLWRLRICCESRCQIEKWSEGFLKIS